MLDVRHEGDHLGETLANSVLFFKKKKKKEEEICLLYTDETSSAVLFSLYVICKRGLQYEATRGTEKPF